MLELTRKKAESANIDHFIKRLICHCIYDDQLRCLVFKPMLPEDLFFFSDKTNFLQLVSSACVAAVKCRPILHQCIVIFFWSSRIIDYMLVWLKNRVLLINASRGVSDVASYISFNQQLQLNQVFIFHIQAMHHEDSLCANMFIYNIWIIESIHSRRFIPICI